MFNEESFIYREPPTLNQRLGRRATIYHEVAHHWFGDDVTMQWFDDLWLKEGFATYMAAKMQDVEGLPNPWMSFYLRNKPAAYDVDQTSGTTPVWQALDNLDQAKSNYGAIVYNKAPGILKQLNYLVGDSAFRAGLHAFLLAHAYGNATWRDLLASIGTAAHRSLAEWGAQYILRPGMPVVEQRLDVSNGAIARLALVQHPAQPLSGPGVWPMRTQLVLWSHDRAPRFLPVEIRAETTVVAAAAGAPGAGFRIRERERLRVRPRHARRPERRLARGAHRRGARHLSPRHALGRALGSRARRSALARAIHRRGDARAARRARRAGGRGHRRAAHARDVRLSVRGAARLGRRLGRARASRRRIRRAAPVRHAEESTRRVHRRRLDTERAVAPHRVARQHVDRGYPATPADALVDRHAPRRAGRAERERR